jgi:hypothetical protein
MARERLFKLMRSRPEPIVVCYVLSTDGDPRYCDLAAVSIASLKRVHPSARVTILTDDESLPAVRAARRLPRGGSISVRSVGGFVGSPRVRSRFVKTQMRGAMDGDFLYLDADTVVIGALDEICGCRAPLAAAVDRNRDAPSGGFPAWVVPGFERLGWPYPTRNYLNNGVIFWKDCAEAHEFGRLWHANWLKYHATVDNPADQPAFNHSMSAIGLIPEILDDRFNARVTVSPEFFAGARIIHYYAHGAERPDLASLDRLMARTRSRAPLNGWLNSETLGIGA